MPDWDKPKYPISYSAIVAAHKHSTSRSWFQKRWLHSPIDPVRPAKGQGGITLVSGRSVMAHSIAARLVDVLSMHPKKACEAARRFTDFSDPMEAPGFNRDPGKLFDGSFTYLAAYPNGEVRIVRTAGVEVKRYNKKTQKRETLIVKPAAEDMLIGIGQLDGCWLLPLDFIVKHVTLQLDKFDHGEAD